MSAAPPEQPDPMADSDSSDPDSQAVLGKLEALLGRLRGADAPAAMPIAQAGIPTLTEPVVWASPDPGIAGAGVVAARGLIPTLTEWVQLRESPSSPPASPPPASPPPDPLPPPLLHTAASATAPQQPASAATTAPAPSVSVSPAIPTAQSWAGSSPQALRDRIRWQIDPELESRLCEAALNRLDDTLADIRQQQRAALDAWREDQSERLRIEVSNEIERAIDAAVEAMLREQPPGP